MDRIQISDSGWNTLRTVLVAILVVTGFACGDDGTGPAAVDAGSVDATKAVVERCDLAGGPICGATETCVKGDCVADACQTEANTCADGDACAMECIPVGDACSMVDCPADTTCYEGSCVAGCFPPSPCLNVMCADGEYCHGGSCFALNACDVDCGPGMACNTTCYPVSPCLNVECEANQVCVSGECRDNPCFGIDCAEGAICVNGNCIETCSGCDCGPLETCIFNECVCVPTCDGKACGDANGCGGICEGCPTAGEVCNTTTGECSCNASCSGKSCGDLNGCGDPCVTNSGCGAGSCDVTVPNSPVCICTGGGLEQCADGDCCSSGQDCIDTNGAGGTDRCCTTASICSEAANDQCCSNSQTCVSNLGCCNNNDLCADTGGNCLCGPGGGNGIAINCSNGTVGDEFCCPNAARACEQAGAAAQCCPAGFTCFDSNDAGTEHDTCCTDSAWCTDSKQCCNIAAGEVCYNDNNNNPNDDSCCAPDCTGKSCGANDGCGGLCVAQTCEEGQSCVAPDPDSVSCQPNACNPQCNPCTEICIAGSCEPKCSDGQTINISTCQCEGGGID